MLKFLVRTKPSDTMMKK